MSTARDYYYAHTYQYAESMSMALYSSGGTNGQIQPSTVGSYNLVNETLLPSTLESSKAMNLRALYQELASYSALKPGWDGYDADVASSESQIDARVFVSSLPPRLILPKPMIASDGEISLYWDLRGAYLEASFPGDGTFHYIFNKGPIRFASDDHPVTSPVLSAEFLSFLEAI
ncbi:hypothetical protein [Pseudomonas sp. CHM02]|uniref:hypothetical protein n=1 Tax=Pseudomonas sp. CHM02 TaxID=1463662 RepID=UPI0012DC714E|nr:hypothetical protein [Pseudomonas sp. CHM02]